MAKEQCQDGPCNEHSGLDARVLALETNALKTEAILNEIRDKLLSRPSWVVCFMFTAMSSMIIGLAIALVLR